MVRLQKQHGLREFRGFVKLKQSKNPRKTWKWVGGSSPNSDFFFWKYYVFFRFFLCCFLLLYMFPKKWTGGGWVWSGQSEFFSDFWIFSNLTNPLVKHTWVEIFYKRKQSNKCEFWRSTFSDLTRLVWRSHKNMRSSNHIWVAHTERQGPYSCRSHDIS